MSILRPYLKSNEVAVDRDVLDDWMNKLHRVGLTLDEPQDALSIRDDMYAILSQPRWTDKQSLTVEDAPPEPTVAVPVATLRKWLEILYTGWDYQLNGVTDAIDALLSTSAEKGPGTE